MYNITPLVKVNFFNLNKFIFVPITTQILYYKNMLIIFNCSDNIYLNKLSFLPLNITFNSLNAITIIKLNKRGF